MFATCNHCGEQHDVDRDEDGAPTIPAEKCFEPSCEAWLCGGGCQELSFACEACGQRFCQEHGVVQDGGRYCLACAENCVEEANGDN